jgi:hypothetical protein
MKSSQHINMIIPSYILVTTYKNAVAQWYNERKHQSTKEHPKATTPPLDMKAKQLSIPLIAIDIMHDRHWYSKNRCNTHYTLILSSKSPAVRLGFCLGRPSMQFEQYVHRHRRYVPKESNEGRVHMRQYHRRHI